MSRIILDESLLTKLPTLHEPAEICDRTGRRLGWYCPSPGKPTVGSTREELERLRQDPRKADGKTTQELMQWLEQHAPLEPKP